MNRTLPSDSTARKGFPIFSGCIAYFAAALAGVARWSKLGNDKHNPGEPLHHARGKSMDHRDCIPRHLIDLADLEAEVERNPAPEGLIDPTLMYAILDEADALAWRSLALSQDLHEKYGGAPLAPGARLPAPADEKTELNPGDMIRSLIEANQRYGSKGPYTLATSTGTWRIVAVKPKATRRAKARKKSRIR